MPILWQFRCFLSEDGTDEIRAWYDVGSKQLQARFFGRLKTLAQLPRAEWNEKMYKDLRGPCSGLGEIKFFADKIQHRPLGFRSGNTEFTILFCAKEKGGKFVPLSACEKALARKSEVLKDGSQTDALWLSLE